MEETEHVAQGPKNQSTVVFAPYIIMHAKSCADDLLIALSVIYDVEVSLVSLLNR